MIQVGGLAMPPYAAELAARIDAMRAECVEYMAKLDRLVGHLQTIGDSRAEGYENAAEHVRHALSELRKETDGL